MRATTVRAILTMLLASGGIVGAQQTGQPSAVPPGMLQGLSQPGFSVERVVMQVGYFLPPAPTAQQRQAGGPGAGLLQLPQADPGLYLTAAQIDGLLPLLDSLHENPYPSPRKAREIQSGLDQTLTREQKKAWEDFVKAVDTAVKRFQSARGGQTSLPPAGTLGQRAQGGAPGGPVREQDPEVIRRRVIDDLRVRMVERRKAL